MLQRIWLVEDKVISHLGFQLTKTKRPNFTLKKCDTAIFLVKRCKPGRNSWVHIFWKYSILQTCVLQSWGCLSFFNTLNANTFLKCSNNNINNKGKSEKEPDMEPPERHRRAAHQHAARSVHKKNFPKFTMTQKMCLHAPFNLKKSKMELNGLRGREGYEAPPMPSLSNQDECFLYKVFHLKLYINLLKRIHPTWG